ncbi:MAG: hypothetical protein JRH03_12490 [Deltaproteobacteria bacterium]|nr:hypothetical protein [Deltaproteobacteria bacterium]
MYPRRFRKKIILLTGPGQTGKTTLSKSFAWNLAKAVTMVKETVARAEIPGV